MRRRGGLFIDRLFRGVTGLSATIIIGILVLLVILLLVDAWPAIQRYGFGFLTGTTWDPVFEKFGAWPYIYGTLMTSAVALVLAAPIAIGTAIFLVEYAPGWFRTIVGFLIELLAAIPSIVYGLWGFFVLAPFMRTFVEPWLKTWIGPIPGIGILFQGPAVGKNFLTGGIILAIMILPTISAVSREVIAVVPAAQREAMLALGATKWEMITRAVLPYARAGIVAGCMLGLARAFGETMAVTLVIGNSSSAVTGSLLTPGYTMASAIANQFVEADKAIYFSAIVEVALVLLLVATVTNTVARIIVRVIFRGPSGLRF